MQHQTTTTTLPSAFAEAWKHQQEVDEGGSVEEALAAWERCDAILQPAFAALFSRNEEIDDFKTSSLRYLLVPHYLGLCIVLRPGLSQRARDLRSAQAHFVRFLGQLERHNGLSQEDLNVWHRERELQPTARRTEKVNRARKERELQQALLRLQKRRGGGLSAFAEENDHPDEELERELWLNIIQLAAMKAIHELEAIDQELPFAARMEAVEAARELEAKKEQQERPKAPEEDIKLVAPGMGHVMSAAAERERKQQAVFGPSWNLPTMSVEEAAAIEMRFAAKSNPQASRNGEGEHEEDEEDESDEAIRKAREWDEYKDTHPSGWGNRINQG